MTARAVLGGVRFDDLDGSGLQLLDHRPRGAPLRRLGAELVVHDERAERQSLYTSLKHPLLLETAC